MPALSPGSKLERYEIVRLVGRGGMGEVYHATDTLLRRSVALKVLRDDTDQTVETGTGGVARLLREARAAAALNHPNSVAIYDLGEAEGVVYIAMELVHGASFRTYSRDPSVDVATKIGWLLDAARALGAAHKAGIVHRDVKPSNIMVSDEGIVKVLDFGLAKPFLLPSSPGFETHRGQVLGTPRYMAPEQLEGSSCDARSDQYSLGLTAYELLSGVYAGGPLVAHPQNLRAAAPQISPELDAVVMKMIAWRARDRYASMEDVLVALRDAPRATAASASEPPSTVTARTLRIGGAPAAPGAAPQGIPQTTLPSAGIGASAATPTQRTLPMSPPAMPAMPAIGAIAPKIATPMNVSSGVFLAGSNPPSGAKPVERPALQAAAPASKRIPTAWIAITVVVALVALATGGILALSLR